jgi:chromosomal replication initiator protein
VIRPDAAPLADYMTDGNRKADARRGSALLRAAILNSISPGKPGREYRIRAAAKRYGSFEERQLALAQIRRLQRAVADHYGINRKAMFASRGPRDISEKRQLAIFLAREVVQSSYPDIAKAFGGKDHTTIIYACRRVEGTPDLAEEAARLRRKISA